VTISIADIDAAEGAIKNVRVKLGELGRAIYQLREGERLDAAYAFDGYTRQNYAGSHFYDQEGPDWGLGTPILSLRFYWSRAEDKRVVTLPLRYLECDWRAEETARLHAEREAAEAASREAEQIAAEQRETSERRQYEALRAKFEANLHD
jgi:hypothetical protein